MLNAIIDLSHHNHIASFDKVKASGIAAIIHKATQGTRYTDPTFSTHTADAKQAGLLVGAYHFGIAGDPIEQAEHFIEVAGKNTLLVLDFEGNPQGHDMSLTEAEHFVHHVKEITGRYPGLYSGHTIKEALASAGINKPDQTELSKCWLWIAQYSKAPLIPKVWNTWTLWQYTDDALINGIPAHCDRDMFNGDDNDLVRLFAGS